MGTLEINSDGTTQLHSNVATHSNQTYNSAVTLMNDVTIDSHLGNGSITFDGTVNSENNDSHNLTINSGVENITFNNQIGNNQPLGILQANSTGTTRFNSTVEAFNLTTNPGGTTSLNSNVTTAGDQNYGDAVVLESDTILNANEFTFSAGLDAGGHSLTLKATEIDTINSLTNGNLLTLQPATSNQAIAIGATNNSTAALDLTTSELNAFQSNFNTLTIGQGNTNPVTW
ncbi:MAG: hypothetical protein RIE73_28800 [Coleofasciculus sp. C1-SOL-03]|uniref:hypothetical protein n=1 Tax=Coleofasciculus sp. C1-SOL-03 TaxID=3069522 RepID=UPI0032FA3E9F